MKLTAYFCTILALNCFYYSQKTPQDLALEHGYDLLKHLQEADI